jgi:predicted O-methyltransferase YrrM
LVHFDMRATYVHVMRIARSAAKATGLLKWLEARRRNDFLLWARSLFAIWDIEDLTRIDCPWWTVTATRKVDHFLGRRAGARVFEWGSGASTIWLAKRAAQVISVEHDAPWFAMVREATSKRPNARLIHVPVAQSEAPDAVRSMKPGWEAFDFRDYVSAIDSVEGTFDLIVIDGRCRVACLERAAKRLKPDGLIVFDNSHRSHYRAAISTSALHRCDTGPLSFCLPYPDFTTLLSPSRDELVLLGGR